MGMDKNIPIFKLTIDDEETGVDYIAMVDQPAIQRNWQAFSETKQKFQADTDKRIITGALMLANLPIYRKDDKMGEYYAVFDIDTIYKIAQRYFKNKFTSNVNIMHDPTQKVDGVYMFESFIVDRARGIKPPKGFEGITDGSWFGSFKVENDEVWNDFIKTGELKGFSVEGIFKNEPYKEEPKDTIQQIINVIDSIK
jgi:hypothetical protein